MASPNFASTSLIKSFQALYNRREESATTDFTVVCQDDSEIPVHSVILSASSDVLEMALTGDFKESHEKKIRLKTYSTKAVQQFIRFLYGFELEQEELKKDLQLAKDLTVMGGVYNIPSLQKAAAEALVDHVKMDNLVEMMDFFKTNSDADALVDHVVKNFDREELISSDVLMKHPEIAVKLLRQSSTPSVVQWTMVLTSMGPSAEWAGGSLGVFDYLQQYNKCPAYRQRHSVTNTQPHYLYRDNNGDWCVGEELGGSSSVGLLNRTKSDSLPTTNWRYSDGTGTWPSDPELTVSTSLPSVCPVINISLHGAAARAQPRAGGEYRPTGEWSAGRPIFSNGDTYLCVVPRTTVWTVSSSPDPDSKGVMLESGSVTWCPASPRAALSQRCNRSSWQYYVGEVWKDGDIRVTQN